MIVKGHKLLLDNFREVLKGYSIDIQDVVRSAILDDIDISAHIYPCRENPYKLEQIRLAKKDGLDQYFFSVDGESLYKIRQLHKKGVDLSQLEKQLLNTSLSPENLWYLLSWIEGGVNISKINVSIIPKNLLPYFDKGLRYGLDMSIYNNGSFYSEDIIETCIVIQRTGNNVERLLNDQWGKEVLSILRNIAKAKTNTKIYDRVLSAITSEDSAERVATLVDVAKRSNISLQTLNKRENGEYIYSIECLRLILSAYISNLDMKPILAVRSATEMRTIMETQKLNNKRTIGGRIVRQPKIDS